MKKYLLSLFLLCPTLSFAQIELSQHYSDAGMHYTFAQIEDTVCRIVTADRYISNLIRIYDLDHFLEKEMYIIQDHGAIFNASFITRYLFNSDDLIEYVLVGQGTETINGSNFTFNWIGIYNENGDSLFNCHHCNFPSGLGKVEQGYQNGNPESGFMIMNDTSRMLIEYDIGTANLYNLPGKLPQCKTSVSGKDETTIISGGALPLKAYPNPSNGKIRIEYLLPESVTRGEILITTSDGREVKRYRVGNMFTDILIEKSELASGAYFYKLITERGESEARKFVITN